MHEVDQKNIEHFQTITQGYEDLINDLNQEIYTLKNEQHELRFQVNTLVAENNKLSENLEKALTTSQSCQVQDVENDQLILNLKEQIHTLTVEKDHVSKLWQEGIKAIDHLEDELKVFQAGHKEFVSKKEYLKLKRCYEQKIEEAEMELLSTQKKLEETTKQAKTQIERKHGEVDLSLENQASALKIVKNLEVEVLRLQRRLHECVEERSQLQLLLENKDDVISGLKKANTDCLNRVTEAVGVVDAALNEKDAALFRERKVKEENEKLVQEMMEIVKESHEKIKSENDKVRNEFSDKQKVFLDDLATAHNEIKNKISELEAATKKCALLENEIERMHKGHCNIDESGMNKLLVLEKNLESTFQKLLLSEKQTIQLQSEKEVIKNDLEQMAAIYERNLKAKELEILTLKSKISRLEDELADSFGRIDNFTLRMSKMDEQIARTEKEFKEQQEKYEKAQTTYQEKLDKITQTYKENIRELQSQVKKKNEINEKWKNETKIINDNLEKMVSSSRLEIQGLKKENKTQKEIVKKTENKLKQYKLFLDLISKDVAKISHLTFDSVS
ncbi:sodium channel and clathrin linker 1-like isoform X2 [Euwallacea fornicatus]|uniref:sodium channel and clathrin linker 1-like isoform X2 n=1 Tax=Euwallacea fornicatus TaxID=995702 RepID=UPI00338E3157